MGDFKKLHVWQKAKDLSVNVYKLTDSEQFNRDFGLKDQMRRSSVSIPSNIAEGAGRGKKEMSHFLTIAIGSSFELETQLILSKETEYLNEQLFSQTNSILDEVQKMLFGLQKSLQ